MRLIKFLFSGQLMGVLLIIFATAIGYATFIENDFDANTAKILIYNARWFEVLLLLMVVNFAGMIFTKELYRKHKINILLIHIALIIIILGAGITRYNGYEGIMHLRNGETSNSFQSNDTYLIVNDVSGETLFEKKLLISPKSEKFYSTSISSDQQNIQLSFDKFFPNASEKLVDVATGDPYINLIVGGKDGRHDLKIKLGQSKILHEVTFSFGDTTDARAIQIIPGDSSLLIRIPENKVDTTAEGMIKLSEPEFVPFLPMTLFQYRGMSFILKAFKENATIEFEPSTSQAGGTPVAAFTINEEPVYIEWGKTTHVEVKDVKLSIYIGQVMLELPFALKLNKFELERYPGSRSPSSFASDVQVIDERSGLNQPYRIYMNNVLSHEGYRFYQSSYDQDENGTILSVNNDLWGTRVTYAGYFLLFGTLIFSFFTKKTRFARILKQINDLHDQRKSLTTLLMIGLLSVSTFPAIGQQKTKHVSKDHAIKFGELLVQNHDGRIMPINTMAHQVLIKVHKNSSYEGLIPEQVLLGMMYNSVEWHMKPFVKINHEGVKEALGIKGEYARYIDFFALDRSYVLNDLINEAQSKSPALRNQLDKEVIRVNERLGILHNLLKNNMLKVLPLPNDPDNRWSTVASFTMHVDSTTVNPFDEYLSELSKATEHDSYAKADVLLDDIRSYQLQEGKSIIPNASKIKLEIFYNKINLFKNLFPFFFSIGVILVAFYFLQVLNPSLKFSRAVGVFQIILVIAFAAQSVGLAIRWHISGHAPWSNGYESMIYISWATMLAGFIFIKKNPVTLGLTSILAGITLLTAHMSWMDPEITNLVPVLKSHWLTIHVATITASYGFLGLAALLGFFDLLLMSFRNKKNINRINLMLRELMLVTELVLMCGLTLLIIGNFLGAIWANESWGRYWGWDPKETWTLVTIIFYSFVLHMNLIPRFRNFFTLNFLSLIGFGTILMTYFGVNYYLSGLHSYAGGDPIPIPSFVYYVVAAIAILSAFALVNQFKTRNLVNDEVAK